MTILTSLLRILVVKFKILTMNSHSMRRSSCEFAIRNDEILSSLLRILVVRDDDELFSLLRILAIKFKILTTNSHSRFVHKLDKKSRDLQTENSSKDIKLYRTLQTCATKLRPILIISKNHT